MMTIDKSSARLFSHAWRLLGSAERAWWMADAAQSPRCRNAKRSACGGSADPVGAVELDVQEFPEHLAHRGVGVEIAEAFRMRDFCQRLHGDDVEWMVIKVVPDGVHIAGLH